MEVCSGDRYFVENILEELDSPGEWYLDRAGRKLYLWPKTPLTEQVAGHRPASDALGGVPRHARSSRCSSCV